jgi:hypothetical protein
MQDEGPSLVRRICHLGSTALFAAFWKEQRGKLQYKGNARAFSFVFKLPTSSARKSREGRSKRR